MTYKKSGFANPFKNPVGVLGLLHPHCEAVVESEVQRNAFCERSVFL